jgi:hypothetical protein
VVVAGRPCCRVALLLAAISRSRLESRGARSASAASKDGRAFDVLKLRTMVTGAEQMGAGLAVSEGDTRITRVGRLLRRTSLDEVPNLINVLRGDGDRRPAPDGADAGRPLHRAPARAPCRQAGDHGLGPGQRAHRAAAGQRIEPTSGTSSTTQRLTFGSVAPAGWSSAAGLYRGEAPACRTGPPRGP